jgi:hypothetical protein
MSIADDKGRVLLKTGSNVSVTGDAIINNRKRKLIPAYELEVKGTWTGERFFSCTVLKWHFHAETSIPMQPPQAHCFHSVATVSAHVPLQFWPSWPC